jgi:hypothetical protein
MMDCNLSWNNHTDLLMKNWISVCYIIINVKTFMSASALKIIYHALFYSAMSYGIIFWGNSLHSSRNFSMQNRQLVLRRDVGIEFRVETCLRN